MVGKIKFLKEEKGLALMSSILILLILLTLGSALLSLATIEYKTVLNQKKSVQALYLAEAGVNLAIAELKLNPHLLENTINNTLVSEPLSLGNQRGTVNEVQLKKTFEEGTIWGVVIESRGEIEGKTRKLVVSLELIQDTAAPKIVAGSANLSNTTVNGDLYLFMPGNHRVDQVNGNIRVNGNLYVEGVVSGDVFATGEIVESKGGKVLGHRYEFMDLELEEIDLEDILAWYFSEYGGEEEEHALSPSVIISHNGENFNFINGKTNVIIGDVSLQNTSYYGTLICGGTLELRNVNFTGIIVAKSINSSSHGNKTVVTVDNHPRNIGEIIMPPLYRKAAINITDWHDVKS